MPRSERLRTVALRYVVASHYGTYRVQTGFGSTLDSRHLASPTYLYRYSYTIYPCPYACTRTFYASPGLPNQIKRRASEA
eukprot:scaffold574123_cov15-Prasinocladus_malaysianus.AAC.1